MRETGSALWEPYFLALLADVYAQAGQVEAGLAALAEALAAAQATGERWAEAELYRLRGSFRSCSRRRHRSRRRKSGYSGPWTSPAASRRDRWSSGPP